MMDICLINREQHIHSRIPWAFECKRQVRTPENLHAKLIDTMELNEQSRKHPENWPVSKQVITRIHEEEETKWDKTKDGYGSFKNHY